MHMFTTKRTMGKQQTGLDIGWLQEGIFAQNSLCGLSGRQHPQDMLNRHPQPANDRFPPENLGIHDNTFK